MSAISLRVGDLIELRRDRLNNNNIKLVRLDHCLENPDYIIDTYRVIRAGISFSFDVERLKENGEVIETLTNWYLPYTSIDRWWRYSPKNNQKENEQIEEKVYWF